MKPLVLTRILLAITNAAEIIDMAKYLHERVKAGLHKPRVPHDYHAEAGVWRAKLKRLKRLYLLRSARLQLRLLAAGC